MAGIIEVKDQGKLRIYDADNSHYIDIVVPSSVTANRTITIPDASFTVPQVTNATHSGEVTGATALTIADNIVDEANLKVSNSAVNGYMLTAQSGNTGGLTWAAAPAGITQADQWRLSASLTGDANPISSNLERVDSTGFGYIGNGMSVSSGVYTFPATGIYLITFNSTVANGSENSRYCRLDLDVTTDNSNFTAVAYAMTAMIHSNSSTYESAEGKYIFDVTNTSTHKVRFAVEHASPNTTSLVGTSTENYTYFTFIRLGDT